MKESSSASRGVKRVSIVTPFYNEADGVPRYFERVGEVLRPLREKYDIEFVCVDDGSRDATLQALEAANVGYGVLKTVALSRNFGKEAALSAGLDFASGDAVIPIDADLQDPPEIIPEMLRRWEAGAAVVLGVRADRSSDEFFKRATAKIFYSLHNRIAAPQLPANVGDFRLMDREVADVVRNMPERQRFMKGLLSWAGFPSESIEYVRPPRVTGGTKWNYPKLLALAIEGFTSFSTAPLRLATALGAFTAIVALLYGAYLIVRVAFFGVDVPGYASLFVAIVLMGSIQLIGIGILGEYVGRIYMEAKQRPVYVVKSATERAA